MIYYVHNGYRCLKCTAQEPIPFPHSLSFICENEQGQWKEERESS